MVRNISEQANSIYSTSQHEALMNRFPLMMTPIGWKEFPTIFLSECNIISAMVYKIVHELWSLFS